ncbi:uncharacterized protein PAE49_005934 [Odontesthes bonariensis]|uniref:uncharacterized protein LOC142380776 n=1 Tax=Odontesthes bonariensis TaxID=219752 RepID=UPI003F5838F8
MQSQRSTSTPPSFDSLSSSDGLLFSDSEQAEDDTDVFLTYSSPSVIIGGMGRPKARKDVESGSPRSQWTSDSLTDKDEEEESYRSEREGKAAHIGLAERDPTSQTRKSEGDLLFARKCAELQGFVRPLLNLLNGLKKGRFDQGLSSFQQSIAMDRIQRIVGVLQRPNCGEKYLNTLLQVEVMLKLWFPQISPQPVSAAPSNATSHTHSLRDTSSSTLSHKHRDQSHIPVKKRRLSWTGTDSPTSSPVPVKRPRSAEESRHDQDERECPPSSPWLASAANQHSLNMINNGQLKDDGMGKDTERQEPSQLLKYNTGQNSEPSLTWVHVAPILYPRKACLSHEEAALVGNDENIITAGRGHNPATQDSSISSTTPPKHPGNQKNPIRCQSQLDVGQQSKQETAETCQGQSQLPLVKIEPLAKVCPTTSET